MERARGDAVRVHHALRIWLAGMEAVRPHCLLPAWLTRRGRRWRVGDFPLSPPVYVLAVGKAAACMMAVVEALLREDLAGGLVITKQGHARPDVHAPQIEASHPLPDEASLQAGQAALRFVARVPPEGTLLVLLSGGASALMEVPRPPLRLADLVGLTRQMLRGGLTIHEMNAVRKHLSRIKGGQLLRHARCRVITLALSDVVGDDPATIGSGPTVPDPTTCDDARRALLRHGLWDTVPPAVREVLRHCTETPKPGDPLFHRTVYRVVGSSRTMTEAAWREARRLGYRGGVLTSRMDAPLEEAVRMMVRVVREVVDFATPWSPPAVILMGGEVTLRVSGEGRGGRAMHFAVEAASRFHPEDPVVVLGGSSDGTDGPTDAAGGVMVPRWCRRLDPRPYLAGFDTYRYLERVGGLLRTGPTCTNVSDLYLAVVGARANTSSHLSRFRCSRGNPV